MSKLGRYPVRCAAVKINIFFAGIMIAAIFRIENSQADALASSRATEMLTGASVILAHDWYPRECCMGIDCSAIDSLDIRKTRDGWNIIPSGETVPFSDARIRTSPDMNFHRCAEEFWDKASPTRCLFVPEPMFSRQMDGFFVNESHGMAIRGNAEILKKKTLRLH